jgi:tetratricopeptide (TPR) repeat protein
MTQHLPYLCVGTLIIILVEAVHYRRTKNPLRANRVSELHRLQTNMPDSVAGATAWASSLLCILSILVFAARFLANKSERLQWGVSLDPLIDGQFRTISVVCLSAAVACLLTSLLLTYFYLRKERPASTLKPILQLIPDTFGARKILLAVKFPLVKALGPIRQLGLVTSDASIMALFVQFILVLALLSGASDSLARNEDKSPILICERQFETLFNPYDDTGIRLIMGNPDTLDSRTSAIIRDARAAGKNVYVVHLLHPSAGSRDSLSLLDLPDASSPINLLFLLLKPTGPTETFSRPIPPSDLLVLLKGIREQVYEVVGEKGPAEPLDLRTANDSSYAWQLMGLYEMNSYKESGLTNAISCFDRAAKLDSSFVAPLLRKANCQVFLLDRRFDSSEVAPRALNQVKKLLSQVERIDSSVASHPLFLKVRGDYGYSMARVHSDDFYRISDDSAQAGFATGLLIISDNLIRDAIRDLVMASVAAPEYYKLKYNLSCCYYQMFLTQLFLGNPDSAAQYIDLAERAVQEASELCSGDLGPRVDLGAFWFSRYLWLEQNNGTLLASAESLLVAANAPAVWSQLDSVWVAQARYHLATIELHKGLKDAAWSYLKSVDSIGVLNAFRAARVDPQMKDIWKEIDVRVGTSTDPVSF